MGYFCVQDPRLESGEIVLLWLLRRGDGDGSLLTHHPVPALLQVGRIGALIVNRIWIRILFTTRIRITLNFVRRTLVKLPVQLCQDQSGLDCRVPRVAAAQSAGRRGARPHRHRHRQGLDPQRPGGEGRQPRPGE